ncbi:Legume-like lectin family protein [Tritrichomonas foetus]|uniref:Legume-like lectin family protein n=1 Tax=Tritrichomonas foetus TaxID=1144522 RepID=A0A1J4KJ92_9EUKA|nr:Legume-like lectin family protein [Tritrichomonas foetus]|eukprot:OHT11016.1 Legume-like lectin family protein [Tritrichomonas foetus]
MFSFFLLRFILSTTSADLLPPFELSSDRKVGYWEFGGSSIVQQDVIMLAPPVQYNKGYVWTNVEIPTGSWSITYKLKIHTGTGGGGFGLWFVDKYGASGPLHGGPVSFKGIGILGTLRSSEKDDSYHLHFNILQNNGNDNYGINTLPKANKEIPLDRSQPFYIQLQFSNNQLSAYFSTKEGQKGTEIATTKITANIRDGYIGVTAQSDAYTSRFDLYGVEFELGISTADNAHSGSSKTNTDSSSGSSKPRQASFGKDAPSGHYSPEIKNLLRNPVFEKTLRELNTFITENEKNPGDATPTDVLDIISEMNTASYDVASFKELNSFVTQTLMPYSQKWHTRTLKIIDHVQSARNIMGAAWNYTHEMMDNMNATIKMSSVKTTFKVIDLAELLTSEADAVLEDDSLIGEQSGLVSLLVKGAIVEFAALVIFFILIQFNSVKEKIFGPSY